MSCDKGISLLCIVNSPLFDAVAAAWTSKKILGMCMWVFPKIMVPPNHPMFNRVFHYFHHPFWGENSLFLETPMCFL